MTNQEWVELFKKEFNVSGAVAKTMLHEVLTVKKRSNWLKEKFSLKK